MEVVVWLLEIARDLAVGVPVSRPFSWRPLEILFRVIPARLRTSYLQVGTVEPVRAETVPTVEVSVVVPDQPLSAASHWGSCVDCLLLRSWCRQPRRRKKNAREVCSVSVAGLHYGRLIIAILPLDYGHNHFWL